jgi:hypothetical protein
VLSEEKKQPARWTARDLRMQFLVAFNVLIVPALVLGIWWPAAFAAVIVTVALMGRARHVNAIMRRQREELEGP